VPALPPALPGERRDRATAAARRRAAPALLTIPDVADHLGASTRHVRRLVERGLLPVHQLGRLVRVGPDDLARLIAVCRES
jgi:excisionase family DNA binding protein